MITLSNGFLTEISYIFVSSFLLVNLIINYSYITRNMAVVTSVILFTLKMLHAAMKRQ